MKVKFFLVILWCSIAVFSQKKAVKTIEINTNSIEISTMGLDDVILENSNSNSIEVILYAENPNEQHIVFEEKNNITFISFKISEFNEETTVFRKFITERLNRANAIIKIPIGKLVTILGDEINIQSKSYEGDLNIFIEKGILKLNILKGNLASKLFEGNIFGTLSDSEINLISNNGKIEINNQKKTSPFQLKKNNTSKKFSVNSINANIFLTTQKTQ